MVRELYYLVTNRNPALATPIESRIKDLASIHHKMKGRGITSLSALNDFIGLRVIVLFQRDSEVIHDALTQRFNVHEREDTGERLADSQFGYQFVHYVVGIRGSWLEIASWENLGAQRCEIQVRTMAQHIWAAASHKLQYKNESSVPASMRRAIGRVSALLETVDLEFERVLNSRDDYRAAPRTASEPLNVENIQQVLDATFPAENRDLDEDYANLVTDLVHFKKSSVKDLEALLSPINVDFAMQREAEVISGEPSEDEEDPDRAARGVYFSHVGLARWCLDREFGKAWIDFNRRDRRKDAK